METKNFIQLPARLITLLIIKIKDFVNLILNQKVKKIKNLLLGFFLFSNTVFAQKYMEMMYDPSVNFYDVQAEAEKYFSKHGRDKTSEWKQYKRWELVNGQRYAYSGGERLINPEVQMRKESEGFAARETENNGTTPVWKEMGPKTSANVTGHWAPGLGRIDVIEVNPDNHDQIFVGTPTGGLWKTTDGGQNWEVLNDFMSVIGVAGIVIDWNNPNVIYLATGDRSGTFHNKSIGVYKSTDGGKTWNPTGLTFQENNRVQIRKMKRHPADPNTIFVSSSEGFYKTTDAGNSWSVSLTSNDITVDDFELKPGNPNVIYASVYRLYGDKDYYKSTDGGATFTLKTAGIPPLESRMLIAVTPANPEVVYILREAYNFDIAEWEGGLYKSIDSGETFTKQGSPILKGTDSMWHYGIAVSPTNENIIHVGEVDTKVSKDGGATWKKTAHWHINRTPATNYIHADVQELIYFENVLYAGTDGLIVKTTDEGDTWINLTEGIGNRQFNRIAVGVSNPNKILGGSVDNGTSVYSNGTWHEWLGADGSEPYVNPNNDNIVYGQTQSSNQIYKSFDGGNSRVTPITNHPNIRGGAYVTPMCGNPSDENHMIIGTSELYETKDGMDSWNQLTSFGWSGSRGGDVKMSISNPQYIYTSLSFSTDIRRTKNGGSTWTEHKNGLPNGSITQIAVHPTNPEYIAIALSGYWDGKKVYSSVNGGDTWINISDNLPNIPANAIVIDALNNGIYVGMDSGVYFTDDKTNGWICLDNKLPNVRVMDLEISSDICKLRAGTYGRGLWQTDLIGIGSLPPIADFKADETYVTVGTAVQFTNLSTCGATSFSWTFEGSTTTSSNLENPSIVFTEEGEYTVSLTVTKIWNNLQSRETKTKVAYIIVESLLAAQELLKDAVQLYPNPNSGELKLMLSKDFNGELITEIFNMQGKKVFEKKYHKTYGKLISKINLSDLSAGFYLVKISNRKQQITKELIIK
ncbi:MAG: T9SS type A sorting domain-containing protein [Ekhidna sp.]|nr:T9SS type A sorting domain-containing protein [Ekhidna sp.]